MKGHIAVTQPHTDGKLWSVGEVAAYLGVPVRTLYSWNYLGRGPRPYRVGRYLRYRPAEVEAWLDAQGPAA